jgi:acyl-CoA reductase-like NAD-dependent aldehyde dehydrogenase
MHKTAYVEYQPLGVLGIIAPWNYPFHNLYNHVISGLFAGNAVVSKVIKRAKQGTESGALLAMYGVWGDVLGS